MKKMNASQVIGRIISICLYYIPPLVLILMYDAADSLPFVSINPLAIVFILILFAAGILLTIGYWWGGLIGIAGCALAFIAGQIIDGEIRMSTIFIYAISAILYIYGITENLLRKK